MGVIGVDAVIAIVAVAGDRVSAECDRRAGFGDLRVLIAFTPGDATAPTT